MIRAAAKLASLPEDVLRNAQKDPAALAAALLEGPDKQKYCTQIATIDDKGGTLDVPVELLQTRVVVAAIQPDLPALAEAVLHSPDPATAGDQVRRAIGQIVSDERLATELDLIGPVLSSGAISRPSDWPHATWPPTPDRVSAIADMLRHIPARPLSICGPAPAKTRTIAEIGAARGLAASVIANAQSWAKTCGLAQLAAIPGVVLKPLAQHVEIQRFDGPDRSDVPTLVLSTYPDDPGAYRFEMKLGSSVLPLGVSLRNVTVSSNHELNYVSDALLPNAARVDASELNAALRRLGIPDIVKVTSAQVTNIDQHVTALSLSTTIKVGSLAQRDVTIDLIHGRKAADLAAQGRQFVATIMRDVAAELRAKAPALVFGDQPIAIAIGKSDDDVVVDLAAGKATIRGELAVRLPDAAQSSQAVHLTAKLSVPLEGGAVQLVDLHWPDDVIENVKKQLIGALPAIDVGRSSCIGLVGVSAKLTNDHLTLVARVTENGVGEKTFDLDPTAPFRTLGGQLLGLAKDAAVQDCVKQQILAMASADAAAAFEELRNAHVNILGTEFALQNMNKSGASDKLEFTANLVAVGELGLEIDGIVIQSSWKRGMPLLPSSIAFTGATLPGAVVDRLLKRLDPVLASWISLDAVSIANGKLAISGALQIPELPHAVRLDHLPLDLAAAKDAIVATLASAAIDTLDQQASSFEDELASLGHLKSIKLDREDTKLNGSIDVVFHVEAEPIQGVVLPFLVHLPSFQVKQDGDFKKIALTAVSGAIQQALGNLPLGDAGLQVDGPLIDDSHRRYGLIFDGNVKLAGLISVELKDIELDQHGLTFPNEFDVAVSSYTPLVPPYVSIGEIGGKVWLHPSGKFGINADIVLSIDPEGEIVKVVTGLTGNGPQRTIEMDGKLLLFRMPLFEATGIIDFAASVITMDARTLQPLASILNMRSKAKIDAKAKALDASSDMKLLGLTTSGQLTVHLSKDKLVRLTGAAGWPLLGSANIHLETTTELHHPTAGGGVDIHFLGAGGDFDMDVAHVRLAFGWHGFQLAVVAPNVGGITPHVIKDLIESLLDFRISFDKLSKIEINLIDKNGKKTDSYGDGGAPGGDADAGGKGASQQTEKTGSGGPPTGGTVTSTEAVADRCSPIHPAPGRSALWARDPQLPANSIEGELDPSKHIIYFSSYSRILSDAARPVFDTGTIVACFDEWPPGGQPFTFVLTNKDKLSVSSGIISVFVPKDGAPRLMALRFAKEEKPVEIALPSGAEAAIFGAGGLAHAAGSKLNARALRMLWTIVHAQLTNAVKIEAVHPIPASTIIPKWPAKAVDLFEENQNGKEMIELSDDNQSVQFDASSPLFALLKADPTGVIAQLGGSAEPITRLDGSPPALTVRAPTKLCSLVLADAGDADHYAVAIVGKTFRVARLVDAVTWSQAGTGWLDASCPLLASLPDLTDVRMGVAPTVGADLPAPPVAMRVRSTDDATKIWLLSVAGDPSSPAGQPSPGPVKCLFKDEMLPLFRNSKILRSESGQPVILDWQQQDNVDRMLTALSGATDDWVQSFLADPRGLFFKKAANRDAGARACPSIVQNP